MVLLLMVMTRRLPETVAGLSAKQLAPVVLPNRRYLRWIESESI